MVLLHLVHVNNSLELAAVHLGWSGSMDNNSLVYEHAAIITIY